MNTFGEFSIDGFEDVGLTIFLMASIINLVILLNLVIAIISEVFTRINDDRANYFYMQRAKLIADVWSVFSWQRSDTKAQSELLLFATEQSVQ